MVDPFTLSGIAWGISAAGWIISPIITKLVNKALSHIKPGKSKDELHELFTHTLPRLALTLEAAEGSAYKDLFEKLVTDLKSAFYDLEDVLDEVEYDLHEKQIITHKKSRRNTRDGASSSDQDVNIKPNLIISGSLQSELKKKVMKIKELIVEAKETIELANLPCLKVSDKNIPTATTTYTRKPNTADPAEKVIGRDEDRLRIIKMLRDTEDEVNASSSGAKCFSVIGICGIPGSGKTTLAQYICESERTADYFHLVMWIHVSRNFSVDTIYREMFEAASAKKCPGFKNLDVLRKELEEKLCGKRFLLVLDDIWCDKDVGDQQLPLLLSPFKVGSRGSKILVTSRNADALSDLGPNIRCTSISIPELGDKVFSELLMYYALGDSRADDVDQKKLKELDMIGTEIAQKLKRSPLAARIVGGQLRKKQNDVMFWRVRDSGLLKEKMGGLLLSYQYLDEGLKRCFAYCSIFPRRRYLFRNELISMWVAEGFIKTADAEEEMEAVAGDYVDELVSTSFLQIVGNPTPTCYLIHDLLHDLAIQVAGKDCFRIENGWKGELHQDVRHLFVETVSECSIIDKIVKLEKLRTLIIYSGYNNTISETVEKILMKLTNLRVLDMRSSLYMGANYNISLADYIGNLKHLRYLSLFHQGGHNLTLPSTITKLYYPRVLDFPWCNELILSSENDMANLTNLRILKPVPADIPNIGRMTYLQGLELFRVKREQGYELRQLENLNKLHGNLSIEGLELVGSKQEALEAKLSDKERLKVVKLAWGSNSSCDQEVQADVLEGLCPPKFLDVLEIRDYPGSRCPDWTVGNTKGANYLESLWLNRCRLLGPSPELFKYFVHLREIILTECNWDTLPNNTEHLKSLIVLRIQRCLNIRSLPVLPQSLKRIEFWGCDEEFMRSCETHGDPNWHVGV